MTRRDTDGTDPRSRASDDVERDATPASDDSDATGAAAPSPDPADAPVEEDAGQSVAGDPVDRAVAEQRERYLRLAAEYDNFRKRTTRERNEAHSRGQAELVKMLLDPLDDLARFAHVDPATVDAATVVQGAEMVEKKLHKTLTALGLEIVDPSNQTFDPNLHEAVATEPALSPEDDHVVARVFQQGYRFNGQLLRPARVVVKQWNG